YLGVVVINLSCLVFPPKSGCDSDQDLINVEDPSMVLLVKLKDGVIGEAKRREVNE
ncbi:hypothetical protein Tco_1387754, partial [Tanacetum coccineum]